MTFDEILTQVLQLLQHEGRVSYRALKRRYDLDDDYLEDLKAEIIQAKQLAIDEEGAVLVWTGEPAATPWRVWDHERTPLSYTPPHLARQILSSRSALEGERKQVTVLFADVADFSTMSEQLEPEAVHTIMDGCFVILTAQVHRYEGTINQFTGDGIMALFGAPITHEDHAVRALHAALDIQAALRDYGEAVQRQWGVLFHMRLGLNTGLVVVGRIGDDLRMDYTAQGDTTNLAARMQQMAPPGTIWAAEATYRLASEAFEWKTVGARAVKGKAAPVAVYEPRRRWEGQSRFDPVVRRGLTPLVGRTPEREQLLAVWRQAQQGHGQVVSVIGEAGFGKSRLLYEFKQQLAQEEVRYVEGTCFPYGESISYLPFLDVVQACCGVAAGCSEAEAKRRIGDRLTTLGVDLGVVAPYLHNLLSFTVEDEVFPKLTPELIRQRTVAALTTLVVAEARQQPLTLILEDVHWIDKATEEVVGSLVEAMAAAPLLLVLVYRPEYMHAWASQAYHARITISGLATTGGAAMVRAVLAKPYASRVPVEPLSPTQSTAMAQELLGTATIPPEVEQLIVTKTQGNPLFIEELTRSLLESGALRRTPEGYILTTPVETLDLPATVQGVLLARIDRLREDLKEVLQVAAVIGRVFSLPVLAQVLPRGAEVEQLLLELEDLEFTYPTSLAPQREYSFKHVLTQEAVYATLLRPKRQAYHARIGQALEVLYPDRLEESAEVLAHHYTRSPHADKAVTYLDLANRKAARANALEEAKGYFDAAMGLLDTLPETAENQRRRVSLLVANVIVFQLLFKFPEYYDLLTRYEPMAAGLGDPGLPGAFYARAGHCEWAFSDLDQSIRTNTKALELCEAAGNDEDAAYAYVTLQWCHLFQGDYAQVHALQPRALQKMAQQFNLRWYVWTFAASSLAYIWLGRWEQAVEEALEERRVAEEVADNSMISFAAWNLSLAYTSKRDLERAVAYGELAVQNAPTPADRTWSQAALAWTWCHAGAPRRGLEGMAAGAAMNRAANFIWGEVLTLLLGEGYQLAGEYDDATRTLTALVERVEPRGMRFLCGSAHRLLGEVALQTNPTEAAPHFEHSITILREIKAENEVALAYAGYGRLHTQRGAIAQARDYFTQALAIFERLGTLGEPDKVRRALATLPENGDTR